MAVNLNGKIKRIKTVNLPDGKGETLAQEIHDMLEEYESLCRVIIIGTYSCSKMTGRQGGTHAMLEDKLKRPLFRMLCILHILESLWKRFFRLVDGKSSSPTNLTGEVGKTLSDPDLRFEKVQDFEPITVDELLIIPEEVVDGLSYDQKVCYHLIQAVVQGPEYFDTHKWLLTAALGKLFEARWVTLLNALLRLYCSTEREKATDDLKRLVHFGVRVYAKAWFDALKHPSIVDGPRIYHRLVVSLSNFDYFKQEEVVRYFLADLGYLEDVPASGDETVASGDSNLASGDADLASGEDKPASVEDHCESLENSLELIPEEGDSEGDDWDDKWSQREVMEFGVHWNAYWAHPENVLVAMFYDEDIEVRQRACEIVLDLQQRQVVKDQQQMEADGQLTVREFVTPFVKWEVESYTDFLDLVGQEEWTCHPRFSWRRRRRLESGGGRGTVQGCI